MKRLNFILCIVATAMSIISGFTPSPSCLPSSCSNSPRTTALQMGFFDAINNAFSNEEYRSPPEGIKATARHILVKTKDELELVYNELESGSSFATVAKQYSACPSGSSGGNLGSFKPGTMVKEFDQVVFDANTNVGEVVGPVHTQFGYHLIVVDKRTGV